MIYLFTEDNSRCDTLYHYYLYEGRFVINEYRKSITNTPTIITYNHTNNDITHTNYDVYLPLPLPLQENLKIIPLYENIADLFICLETHKLDLVLDGLLI